MRISDRDNRPGGSGRLGRRTVARIGFGAMQLGRDTSFAAGNAGHHVLRHAVNTGVNHIDTAQFYGAGRANRLIRSALWPYADDLTIVSKVGATPDPCAAHGMRLAQRPPQLRHDVEANLRSLGCDTLPVVNVRRLRDPQELGSIPDDQVVDLDAQLAEMMALRDEGKIAAIGLSGVTHDEVLQALPADIVCVQNAYSVTHRDDEDILELCSRHDIAWVPFNPLGSSRGNSTVFNDVRVARVASDLDATPAQVGLAWLLARDPCILLIPGTTDLTHLSDNVAAGDLVVSRDSLDALDAAGGD